MTDEAERLRVELGDRGYEIVVGPRLIENAGREVSPLLRRRQGPPGTRAAAGWRPGPQPGRARWPPPHWTA